MKKQQYTFNESIAHDLKEKILNHYYKPNDKLPSVLELCELYEASDSTIRKSLEFLKKNGYVYAKKRIGIFVSDSTVKNYFCEFHELDSLTNITDHYELLSIDIYHNQNGQSLDFLNPGKYLKITRMYYVAVLPILFRIDYIAFNANFTIHKNKMKNWIDEMDFVLNSYLIRKEINIQLENHKNDVKDKLILPYSSGMFKIIKKY
ncbi:MAG: GntR family transcriptional regulator, partial [Eubacterium sp.]